MSSGIVGVLSNFGAEVMFSFILPTKEDV